MISDEYLALLAGPDDVDGDLRVQLRMVAQELLARRLADPHNRALEEFAVIQALRKLDE